MSAEELRREQSHLDRLYARLDELRARTAAELARVRRAGAIGTPQARSERDAFAVLREQRLTQLDHAESGLCFGRLDLRDGQRRYIGRIGLSDDAQHQLLVDWRAPAAEDFYRATPASPGAAVRRRHLVTRARTVTGIEDEVLDLDALGEAETATLAGEGMMLAAINAARTGRMGDIVATIQAEQDRVIRSPLDGVLVVQGGPGTGKTAVALHRTAYLLYTHRERLARRGVLVVGPSPVFLRYIEQVLPSLGETGVAMTTPAELFPGVVATASEPAEVARLKGDLRMAQVMAAAVHNRVRLPDEPRHIRVDGALLELTPARMAQARDRARRTGRPHNAARVTFVLDLLDHLAEQAEEGVGPRLGGRDRSEIIDDLRASRDVRRELNLAWPPLTAEGLLSDLYARPDRLRAATSMLTEAERQLLARDHGAPWTLGDVPLLDEVAALIGEDDSAARAAARAAAAARAEEVEYAKAVLNQVGGSAAAMVTAQQLASRFGGSSTEQSPRGVVERASVDRTWEFGHVVVDEAQELSPMAWRLLGRRCPSASMTVVGDVAQTASAAGASAWRDVLDPVLPGRWRMVELTVNYRTPAQIMDLAARVLVAARGATGVSMPSSVRQGRWPPLLTTIDPGDLESLTAVVKGELDMMSQGRIAVVGPRAGHRERVEVLSAALGEGLVGSGPDGMDRRVGVFTPDAVKGLEFDVVVLVEPGEIVVETPRGVNDLYVSMTRATQRLHVVSSGGLPAGMESLRASTADPADEAVAG